MELDRESECCQEIMLRLLDVEGEAGEMNHTGCVAFGKLCVALGSKKGHA
jgi:hypothetical protein